MNTSQHAFNVLNSGRRLKLYLVELDDDNRERVISAVVQYAGIEMNTEYDDVYITDTSEPVRSWMASYSAEMTLRVVPSESGHLFTIENFYEEEEE